MNRRPIHQFDLTLEKKIKYVLVSIWCLAAFYFALHRSLWGDEWNHVQDLKHGLFYAIRAIVSKPSPFAPGEALLNGVLKVLMTPLGVPEEIWARLQGILWAMLALGLPAYSSQNAIQRGQAQKLGWHLNSFFLWLLSCSVALLSLALEMRPYSSLLFSGVLALRIVENDWVPNPWALFKKGSSSFERNYSLVIWMTLLLGHIYGTCFVLAAIFLVTYRHLKKYLPYFILSFVYLVLLFSQFKIQSGQGGVSPYPPIDDFFKQSIGFLGNPHKASYLYLPFFVFGQYRLRIENRALSYKINILLVLTVLGPIAATILGGYFYVPRQIAAGIGPFLYFVAYGFVAGLNWVRGHFPRLIFPLILVSLSVSAGPWVRSNLLKEPPFANQPFHRFKEVVALLQSSEGKVFHKIIFADYCNMGPFLDYFEKANVPMFNRLENMELNSVKFNRVCWTQSQCLYIPMPTLYCSCDSKAFAPGSAMYDILKQESFDLVIHNLKEDLPMEWVNGARQMRSW